LRAENLFPLASVQNEAVASELAARMPPSLARWEACRHVAAAILAASHAASSREFQLLAAALDALEREAERQPPACFHRDAAEYSPP
jgi:hypothetical protein